MRFTLIYAIVSFLHLSVIVTTSASFSKPGCPDHCGDVAVPYPFGIGPECSATWAFEVTCQSSALSPKPFLSSINLELVDVSVETATVRVMQPVPPLNCSEERKPLPLERTLRGSSFTISAFHNSLMLLGCDKSLWVHANTTLLRACVAVCDANSSVTSCSSVNCCQVSIPKEQQELVYSVYHLPATTRNNPGSCGYGFLAEQDWFQKNYKTYGRLRDDVTNPFDERFGFASVVLEWELKNATFSNYSSCKPVNETSSTRLCSCNNGFQGNPYLLGGCQDIDECKNSSNRCSIGTCINTEGSYMCHSRSKEHSVFIALGSSFGSLLLLTGALGSYKIIWKTIEANRKKKFFKRNGGALLEQHLSSADSVVENAKLFSVKELAQATDNFDENRELGRGGQGTVYKGMLRDGRIVAIKKSKKVDRGGIDVFINEVVVLSQINHRHVVKLLGCCLESEVPLLVYEFVPNGTLFQHIHDPNEEFPLTWAIRVRVASEVARAVSYLHSAASAPIYHRDIKSANILLDDKYRAKVADFGTSRSLSVDQTHLTTRVLGTFGYFDPQYFQSNKFTDKSDVYSFGVVMVELLTGERAVLSINDGEGQSLVANFLHAIEENHLSDILDARVLKEGRTEDIMAVAELARRCLNLTRNKRPTMREVAAELERIHRANEGLDSLHHDADDIDSMEFDGAYGISSSSSNTFLDSSSTHPSSAHPFLAEQC